MRLVTSARRLSNRHCEIAARKCARALPSVIRWASPYGAESGFAFAVSYGQSSGALFHVDGYPCNAISLWLEVTDSGPGAFPQGRVTCDRMRAS